MVRMLKILLLLEFIGLSVWTYASMQSVWVQPSQGLIIASQGYKGAGGSDVTEDQIRPYFERARERMTRYNDSANQWASAARIASFLSFLLATLTTAIAAFYGLPDPPVGSTAAQAAQFLRDKAGRRTWLIGLIAASIAVATAFTERAGTEATHRYKKADDALQIIRQTRIALADEKLTRAQVFDLLDDMDLRTQR